ncbi:gamma-glutamyltransferase [Rhodohalobacter barkolensis]|uniref:Glutathione hydrolase proenzyme n=1 Tax=Rhodohalobacter barkolensis TaxID=2053187 RepID=A0A2N0VM34_9BACT|nr:gamma-glutamyltransferase [Rhodohalobacter barkolensis]PKD45201.1 gamma-glutamyltransferase [Rhodohalobacter barkolensis]
MSRNLLSLLFIFLFTFFSSHVVYAQVGQPESFKNGVVTSADQYASEAGLEILQKGGNAIDAAVAVQFALAVTLPRAGNIGGGGFMVLHTQNGEVNTLDFREKAPSRASRDMYLDEDGNYLSEKSKIGGLASGVPGTVDGMITALERYGTFALEVVMEPAIRLAEEGYTLTHSQARSLNSAADRLREFEGSREIFIKPDGSPWNAGDQFVQRDLAETLKRIANMGRRGFYSGLTGRMIVDEMRRAGGIITLRDLRDYKSVWRDPIKAEFMDYELFMMPPPSSGGIVFKQVLEMLHELNIEEYSLNSADYVHRLAESFRRSFADRNYWLGDPDYANVPMEELQNNRYLTNRISNFDPKNASSSEDISHGEFNEYEESDETTHFNVADQYGNVVAVNTTLNGSFGSFVTVSGAGFLMNNEMDDFSAKPGEPNMFGLIGAEANSIEPGKRMLSSMSPTIAIKDGKPVFAGGGAGGPRIITATLQNFLNIALFDMNALEAISAPRIHHQWLPDQLYVEGLYFSEDTIHNLTEYGHQVQKIGNIALTHLILIDPEGLMQGAADSRSYGSVAGY